MCQACRDTIGRAAVANLTISGARCDVIFADGAHRLFINGTEIGGIIDLDFNQSIATWNNGEIRLVLRPTSVTQYGKAPEAVKVKDGWEAEPETPEPPLMSDVPARVGRYRAVKEALSLKEKK